MILVILITTTTMVMIITTITIISTTMVLGEAPRAKVNQPDLWGVCVTLGQDKVLNLSATPYSCSIFQDGGARTGVAVEVLARGRSHPCCWPPRLPRCTSPSGSICDKKVKLEASSYTQNLTHPGTGSIFTNKIHALLGILFLGQKFVWRTNMRYPLKTSWRGRQKLGWICG